MSVAANPLLARRPEQHVQLVLITSDKGLAGAFNANLIKARSASPRNTSRRYRVPELIGRKGRDFFRKRAAPITGRAPRHGQGAV
jgi:F-type H+-transporting ATPase subunit gamma